MVLFSSLCLSTSHLRSERQQESIRSFPFKNVSLFVLTKNDCNVCFNVAMVGTKTDLQYFVSENKRKNKSGKVYIHILYEFIPFKPFLARIFTVSPYLLRKIEFSVLMIWKTSTKTRRKTRICFIF